VVVVHQTVSKQGKGQVVGKVTRLTDTVASKAHQGARTQAGSKSQAAQKAQPVGKTRNIKSSKQVTTKQQGKQKNRQDVQKSSDQEAAGSKQLTRRQVVTSDEEAEQPKREMRRPQFRGPTGETECVMLDLAASYAQEELPPLARKGRGPLVPRRGSPPPFWEPTPSELNPGGAEEEDIYAPLAQLAAPKLLRPAQAAVKAQAPAKNTPGKPYNPVSNLSRRPCKQYGPKDGRNKKKAIQRFMARY
jgi:hypothetical protein